MQSIRTIYIFTFIPTDGKTPVIKYGISDATSLGLARVMGQVAKYKALYGASVSWSLVSWAMNRAHAEFIERKMVTEHFMIWNTMPRDQIKPEPFKNAPGGFPGYFLQ